MKGIINSEGMKKNIYNRMDLVNFFKPFVSSKDFIIAAWEGGSAATNRLDQYSDLDLCLVVEDDQVERTFQELDSFIDEQFGIIRKYRLPEPTWHGASQCFYVIDHVEPMIYLDIAVLKKSNPDKLMESDRHGHAVVWFDHEHIYNPTPSDPNTIKERGKKLFATTTQMDFLIMLEIEKGILRGRFYDVFPTYMGFISRYLSVFLNLKYRPEKADFGLRYGLIDYDQKDALLVEYAFKVSTIDELKHQYEVIKQRYFDLIDELKQTWS